MIAEINEAAARREAQEAVAAALAHADTLGSILNDTSTVDQCLDWLDEEERLGRAAAEAFVKVVPSTPDAPECLWRNLKLMSSVLGEPCQKTK